VIFSDVSIDLSNQAYSATDEDLEVIHVKKYHGTSVHLGSGNDFLHFDQTIFKSIVWVNNVKLR
jgi:hypothetical protein